MCIEQYLCPVGHIAACRVLVVHLGSFFRSIIIKHENRVYTDMHMSNKMYNVGDVFSTEVRTMMC